MSFFGQCDGTQSRRLETAIWGQQKTARSKTVTSNAFSSVHRQSLWSTQKGMCEEEKLVRKEWFAMQDVFNEQGHLIPFSKFYQTLSEHPWRRLWIIAILQLVHADQDIAPPTEPVYSESSLAHLRNLSHKVRQGLNNLSFLHVYQTWRTLLTENGYVHPTWNVTDCEFTSHMTHASMLTCRILEEILSFKRQECFFTYELLGLTHIDMDDVFDWLRVELRGRDWLGIDIPDGARCDGKVLKPIKKMCKPDVFSFAAAREEEKDQE